MKKILATVLAVMMMVTVMAVPAFAAEAPTFTVVTESGNDVQDVVVFVGETITATVSAIGEVAFTDPEEGDMPAPMSWYIYYNDNLTFKSATFNGSDVTEAVDIDAEAGFVNYHITSPTIGSENTFAFTFVTGSGTSGSVMLSDGDTTYETVTFTVGSEPGEYPGAGGETDEPETPTETPTGTLTGETLGDVTLSQWAEGSVLELDTEYTIPVIGNLDENDNDVPDKEEDLPIEVDPTIDVLVYWTDMEFNYSKEWSNEILEYSWNWKNGEDYIQVENRSSVGVTAALSFTGATGYENAVEFSNTDADGSETEMIGATWANNTMTLSYGNQGTEEEVVAPTGKILVNVTEGTTMETTDDNDEAALWTTLGQITITVSKVTE